ncbi:hypothetical protein HPB50_010825 [Hyalomma asiaticum]|uniref:Uncharacterized protein n=1 Tax=Hyalomma asiaticum TaxID=266040 RepID=A0ACB7RM56_HYAAI|nr:hypothetical protein HPB50_010825 [Hyalomma asiaticum]
MDVRSLHLYNLFDALLGLRSADEDVGAFGRIRFRPIQCLYSLAAVAYPLAPFGVSGRHVAARLLPSGAAASGCSPHRKFGAAHGSDWGAVRCSANDPLNHCNGCKSSVLEWLLLPFR